MRKVIFLAVLAAIGVIAYGASASSSSNPPGTTVQTVTDGDTITVLLNNKKERVRFIGVDTPETVDPKRPVGCYGKEASAFTKATLPKGTKVRLVIDAEARDRYGRLLAYVYRDSDGMFVNAELAKQGYAQQLTIPPNVAHVDEFTALVDEARQNNKGLWAKCAQP